MTDPRVADRTYIEPITPEFVEAIIRKERPDALLPTLGGQTGLNTAMQLAESGVLERYGCELIGARADAIRRAEDREEFKRAMERAGLGCLRSQLVTSVAEAEQVAAELGYPVIVRASFTLGGTGGGTAHNVEELRTIVAAGLAASLKHSVLIEESVLGWKEFELEVMRDRNDNAVIVCSIENVDPMGVHTGDSITVAPVQTLSDAEYQVMRDGAITVLRAVGVETGGSNVQFAVHPRTGRQVVIEMNPRVSRSSALASKATGFPIAKIAAKLAVGYTLDELRNDITKQTPACFEPALDYCVVKIPRFAFEKFPGADPRLGVSMKSVGETMAIGGNFREALQKALRGLEIGVDGLDLKAEQRVPAEQLEQMLESPGPERIFAIKCALKRGMSVEEVAGRTHIDPWFVDNIAQIVEIERKIVSLPANTALDAGLLWEAKRSGFSDRQLAALRGGREEEIRRMRQQLGVRPVFRLVDTCAGEFEAVTPYYYSTYCGTVQEARVSDRRKVMVIGGGPNRIGQGIEFDYCCVHVVQALRELGYETVMVNNNPETVSTDYDTSDKLYFEPLTLEDVLNIYEVERPLGAVVQVGGQTPLNLAMPLKRAGVPILGTTPEDIHRAEDREETRRLLESLSIPQPASGSAMTVEEALAVADRIGYPVMIRPSYVLGGRAMMVANNPQEARPFVEAAFRASPGFPVLVDRFLDRATEVDVDLLCDGRDVYIGGIMEHVEEAGIHSGDSACCVPPHTLHPATQRRIETICRRIALALDVRGLMNVQLAVRDNEIYVLEINPRASRTVPYVSKATGVPLARLAARIMVGESLAGFNLGARHKPLRWFAVKEAVLPFNRFRGVDPILGPEMKSTGEVMGIGTTFEEAYWKSQIAAGTRLPERGLVFLSMADRDKNWAGEIGWDLSELGYQLASTEGTAEVLRQAGVDNLVVLPKIAEQRHPNILDLMREGKVALIINTPSGARARLDEVRIRSEAVRLNLPMITTVAGARATIRALRQMRRHAITVTAIQDIHPL
ncbi:MAG: carbamoyl-phosphate synthase large subunit [Verrucomicrobiae bacterium]|nr:carbamoyl-phosphate synthase large subunit [Verrucomicrobiae bacterium]